MLEGLLLLLIVIITTTTGLLVTMMMLETAVNIVFAVGVEAVKMTNFSCVLRYLQ